MDENTEIKKGRGRPQKYMNLKIDIIKGEVFLNKKQITTPELVSEVLSLLTKIQA